VADLSIFQFNEQSEENLSLKRELTFIKVFEMHFFRAVVGFQRLHEFLLADFATQVFIADHDNPLDLGLFKTDVEFGEDI